MFAKCTITEFNGEPANPIFTYHYANDDPSLLRRAARWAVEDYIREHGQTSRPLISSGFTATVLVEPAGGGPVPKPFTREIVVKATYNCWDSEEHNVAI